MNQSMTEQMTTEEYSYYLAYGDDYRNEYDAKQGLSINNMIDDLISDLDETEVK